MKKPISALVGTAFAAAMIFAGAQTASATDAVPAPSAAGGIVSVCADESVNLNAIDGSVLSTDEQQQLIDHAARLERSQEADLRVPRQLRRLDVMRGSSWHPDLPLHTHEHHLPAQGRALEG